MVNLYCIAMKLFNKMLNLKLKKNFKFMGTVSNYQ